MAKEVKNEALEASEKEAKVDAVKKEIEELLAAAKEVAAGIIEDAKKEAESIRKGIPAVSDAVSEDVKAAIARGEELVEVTLFRDNGKYSDDVYVSVNGENCIIKRGEPVMIKRKFKEVLDNSAKQDRTAADMQRELSDEYKKKTESLGI
ncbi:MAG: hypothetical protein E7583_03075 [Ruminococcaceae bacterium]|nr:hypothetical protein [Oscillospiraceae bacterium]